MDRKKEKRRKRRESSSSSSSTSSSDESLSGSGEQYLSDLNAFLHSQGVVGTSHRDGNDTPPKGRDTTRDNARDNARGEKKGEPRVVEPVVIAEKRTIPLPASSAHMPKKGNPLPGPQPPSSAK